ncbi:Beta-glucosidase-like SFR2, chloroplastic-like protein, partial [Drosera capensis]
GEDEFFFGLATAPAHVEDNLNDAWLQFAEDDEAPCEASEPRQPCQMADAVLASFAGDGTSHQASAVEPKRKMLKRMKSQRISMEAMIIGYQKYIEVEEPAPKDEHSCHEHSHHVAASHNVPHPEERLRFWSDPDTELKLAKNTGITVFRMGVDWSRVFPKEPTDGLKDTVNFAALERYRWILHRVHSYGMKVMLTLFHHSLPPWAGDYGGWKLEKTVDYFMDFTRHVVDNLSDLVDYWVTFNEPHIFCMLTYTAGAWPGGHPDMLEVATSTLPTSVFNQTMHWMAVAHSKAYDYIHEHSALSPPIVGVAYNVSFTRPYGLFDVAAVTVANSLTLYPYLDSICGKMDFIGLNYYGQVATTGKITRQDRQWAWYELRKAVKEKRTRPFYREVNKQGLMSAGGLDVPTWRPYVDQDWRFGHYEMEELQDPLSRFWRSIRGPFFPRMKIAPEDDPEVLLASSI